MNGNSNTVKPEKLTATFFNKKEFQTQRKNHFEVVFNGDFIDSNMKFLVVSFPLPKENSDPIEMSYFNQTIKTAGKTSFETSSLVIRDALEYDTEKKFMDWSLRVYNPKTGKQGYAQDYKTNATVYEYSPNGETVRTWHLEGCWPSAVDYGDLTYEDQTEKQITITIVYDFAYRTDINSIDTINA